MYLLTLLLIGFFLTPLNGCITVANMKKNEVRVLNPQEESIKAVVIVAHGLNLKPERMSDWSLALAKNGAQVFKLSLHGHDNKEDMSKVTPFIWRSQFDETYKKAHDSAKKYEVPIYFLGFSLGALLALEWLSNNNEANISAMALIAPAISTPWYARGSIKLLSILGDSFKLPSRSPKPYRANKGTTIAAYKALFSLKESLENNCYKNSNINTLVLVDPHDELVNSGDIRKTMIKFKLTKWRLTHVDNSFAYKNYGFRHLMVDKNSVGQKQWSSMVDMVLKQFSLSNY